MRGSGGSNNLFFIKPGRFNEIYLRLLREFYVNKYKTSIELQNYLSLKTSTFSENKSKLFNALGTSEQGKKGAPISVVKLTENTKEPDPFNEIYYRCIDDSSIYFLNIMLAFHMSKLTEDSISVILENSTVDRFNSIKTNTEGLLKMEGPTANCKRIYKDCNELCGGNNPCPIADLARISCKINNKGGLYINDVSEFLRKIDNDYKGGSVGFSFDDIDLNTKINKMERLCDIGILEKEGRKYHISDNSLDRLGFCNDPRFKLFLSFFSEIHPFGAIGYNLLRKIDRDYKQSVFRYSDRFIFNTINDYNLINILFAIKNSYALRIEYVRPDLSRYHMTVIPIVVRQSTADGRQFLIYYTPKERSVSALRIEYIEKMEIGSYVQSGALSNDLKNAAELIDHCWSSGFEGFTNGNCVNGNELPLDSVEVDFRIPEDKAYIVEYLKREIRIEACELILTGQNNYRMSCSVTHYEDLIPWLNTYPEYVVDIRVKEAEVGVKRDHGGLDLGFKEIDRLPSDEDLFCPENSISYAALYGIYTRVFRNDNMSPEQMSEILREISEYKKGKVNEEHLDELSDFFDRLKWLVGHSEYSGLIKDNSVELPLSRIEMTWLLEAVNDERAGLFLDADELNGIRELFGAVNGLYSINDIDYYDRIDSSAAPTPEIFRSVARAINERKELEITYKKQSVGHMVFRPESIVFSPHEYTFKLNCLGGNGKYYALRLDFILEAEVVEDSSCDIEKTEEAIGLLTEYESLKIGMFETTKNITDRFFRDISAYSVDCVNNKLYEQDREAIRSIKALLQNEAYGDCRIEDIWLSDGQVFVSLTTENGVKTCKADELIVDIREKTPNTLTRITDHDENWFEYVVTIHYPKASAPYLLKKISAYGNELFIIDHDKNQNNYIINSVAASISIAMEYRNR